MHHLIEHVDLCTLFRILFSSFLLDLGDTLLHLFLHG